MNVAYVVHLEGKGNNDAVYFASQEEWDWMHERALPMPLSVREGVLREAREDDGEFDGMTDDEVIAYYRDSDSTWKNDRAMAAWMGREKDDWFVSLAEAMLKVAELSLKIEATYEGFIF